MMVIDNKYELGQIVYLVTDTDQQPRMITMFKIFPGSTSIMYQLSFGREFSDHYDCEISTEENIAIKVK